MAEMPYLVLVPLLFGLSIQSGMLGLGVAFVAGRIPHAGDIAEWLLG